MAKYCTPEGMSFLSSSPDSDVILKVVFVSPNDHFGTKQKMVSAACKESALVAKALDGKE